MANSCFLAAIRKDEKENYPNLNYDLHIRIEMFSLFTTDCEAKETKLRISRT